MSMKKLVGWVFLLSLVISVNAMAQGKKDSLSFSELTFQKYANIYQLANQFNDPDVARMALYEMLMYSGNQPALLDTLALNYYSNGKTLSAVLVSQENLRINPNNLVALEISAVGFQQLGLMDKSLENYEKLYLKDNSSSSLYQIAFLQVQLGLFQEASATIETLLLRDDIDEIMLNFNTVDKKSQAVSMRAAILNLKGVVAKESNEIAAAKKLFLEAIQLSPSFELAQLNLRSIRDME